MAEMSAPHGHDNDHRYARAGHTEIARVPPPPSALLTMPKREAAPVAPSFPPTRTLYERDLASTRAQLDAETFEAAWAEGLALTLDGAAAEALRKTG